MKLVNLFLFFSFDAFWNIKISKKKKKIEEMLYIIHIKYSLFTVFDENNAFFRPTKCQ